MTDEELAAIKARCEAATPGPWSVGGSNDDAVRADGWHGLTVCRTAYHSGVGTRRPFTGSAQKTKDADFIACARSDIPALLAEIERLRGKKPEGWVLTHEGHERVSA